MYKHDDDDDEEEEVLHASGHEGDEVGRRRAGFGCVLSSSPSDV